MLKTAARLNLILSLNKYGLDLGLLKDYKPDCLLKLCVSLEERKTPRSWYTGCPDIQKELLDDERFFFYLDKLSAASISLKTIDAFIKTLHSYGETTLDYPIGRLLSGMVMTVDSSEVFYDYLKNFSGLQTNKEQKETIITNLCLYRKLISKPVDELSDTEKNFFMEPCLTNTKLIPDEIDRVFVLFARHPALLDIIRFLYEKKKLKVSLSIDKYESFCTAPAEIRDNLKTLHKLLDYGNMGLLMTRWLENNCPLHDLEVLRKKLIYMNDEQIEDALYSRSGYLNQIYGSKINNIPLSGIPKYKEDVLIYAITNNKNGFLRLIEENSKTLNYIGAQSILFKREFYARHMNLNTLNANNLLDCRRMSADKMLFKSLEPDRNYFFEEIKALYGQPEQYYKLYAGLQIPRIDDRLVVLRQLTKHKLLADVKEGEYIGRLADALSQKPLSLWREQDFAHIDGLKHNDAVRLLIHRTEIEKLIPQMKTRIDACLVMRNWNSARNYNTIDEMKSDLIKIDDDWRYLVDEMEFSESFLQNNEERVFDFLCKNGAEIVKSYYDDLDSDSQLEAMKYIVKAELMGEFNKLKYFDDDLRREIDYPITNTQKAIWMENTEASLPDGTLIKECDDFYNTMMLGIVPQRTCLSYIDGQHKECLMSSFDSNKKALYSFMNGKIVGRSLARLTKGRFSNSKKQKDDVSLTFVDLETYGTPEAEKENEAEKERLVLFLERSYAAGISEEAAEAIDGIYIDLMAEKAEKMGAMLVVSNSYYNIPQTDFTRTLFHLYISKSKAGAQYLDSLNGNAIISDEGGYRVNNFYIRKNDIL